MDRGIGDFTHGLLCYFYRAKTRADTGVGEDSFCLLPSASYTVDIHDGRSLFQGQKDKRVAVDLGEVRRYRDSKSLDSIDLPSNLQLLKSNARMPLRLYIVEYEVDVGYAGGSDLERVTACTAKVLKRAIEVPRAVAEASVGPSPRLLVTQVAILFKSGNS